MTIPKFGKITLKFMTYYLNVIKSTNLNFVHGFIFIFIQIRVRAYDGGQKTAEALITVTVNRNLNDPVFSPAQYEKEILDNEPLASSIVKVVASDADTQVIYLYLFHRFI